MVKKTVAEYVDDTLDDPAAEAARRQKLVEDADLEAAKEKYPMQSIMYEGELDTHLYNRFMLIGIK